MPIKKTPTAFITDFFQHHSSLAIWVLGFPLVVLLLVSEDFRESEIYSRIGWALVVVSLAYLIRSKKIYLILLIPFFLTGLLKILVHFP
jgi:heptose-I-phosphate ethanolaminephosphotransferase